MVLTSDGTLDEYKKADRVSKKSSQNFEHILELQLLGLAMPLLEMRFHKRSKFGSNKLFIVNKFTPPPPNAQRSFDKHKDNTTSVRFLKTDVRVAISILSNLNQILRSYLYASRLICDSMNFYVHTQNTPTQDFDQAMFQTTHKSVLAS